MAVVVLRNYLKACEYVRYSVLGKTIVPCPVDSCKASDGFYLIQDGVLYCKYVLDGNIHLVLDGIDVLVDKTVSTSLHDCGTKWRFKIMVKGKEIYQRLYNKKAETDGNPFWPSDPEDEDIVMWFHHVVSKVNSPE